MSDPIITRAILSLAALVVFLGVCFLVGLVSALIEHELEGK